VCRALRIQSKWNKALQFLKDQGDKRLELEKQLFRIHCNPNVIPNWTKRWQGGGPGGSLEKYWCCVCQCQVKPDELLATNECTKRELEVTQGLENTPTGHETHLTSQRGITRRTLRRSPEGPSGGASRPWGQQREGETR
jgi:hypothetical protein